MTGTCPRKLLGDETIHLVLKPQIPSWALPCNAEAGGGMPTARCVSGSFSLTYKENTDHRKHRIFFSLCIFLRSVERLCLWREEG